MRHVRPLGRKAMRGAPVALAVTFPAVAAFLAQGVTAEAAVQSDTDCVWVRDTQTGEGRLEQRDGGAPDANCAATEADAAIDELVDALSPDQATSDTNDVSAETGDASDTGPEQQTGDQDASDQSDTRDVIDSTVNLGGPIDASASDVPGDGGVPRDRSDSGDSGTAADGSTDDEATSGRADDGTDANDADAPADQDQTVDETSTDDRGPVRKIVEDVEDTVDHAQDALPGLPQTGIELIDKGVVLPKVDDVTPIPKTELPPLPSELTEDPVSLLEELTEQLADLLYQPDPKALALQWVPTRENLPLPEWQSSEEPSEELLAGLTAIVDVLTPDEAAPNGASAEALSTPESPVALTCDTAGWLFVDSKEAKRLDADAPDDLDEHELTGILADLDDVDEEFAAALLATATGCDSTDADLLDESRLDESSETVTTPATQTMDGLTSSTKTSTTDTGETPSTTSGTTSSTKTTSPTSATSTVTSTTTETVTDTTSSTVNSTTDTVTSDTATTTTTVTETTTSAVDETTSTTTSTVEDTADDVDDATDDVESGLTFLQTKSA